MSPKVFFAIFLAIARKFEVKFYALIACL